MKKVNNIAKNTSYFTIALIFQKVISFTYFAILAKYLPPEVLGKYYFAISFASVFGIFIDVGMANLLTREVSKSPEKSTKLIGAVIAIKLPLTIVSFFLIAITSRLLGYSGLVLQLIFLSAIAVTLDSFTFSFYSVSRGHHNLSFESISSVVFQLIVLTIGIVGLKFNLGLKFLMGALVFGSIFNFFYSIILIKIKWGVKIRPKYSRDVIFTFLRLAAPFGAFAIFQRAYTFLDSVLLGILAGDYYVGLYQLAFKIIFSIQFLPMAFVASLYPAMSTYWKTNKKQLATTFERAFMYLLVISLPISFGISMLAAQIINLFNAEYIDAVQPIIIVVSAIPFMFLSFPLGSLLNASDRQKLNTFVAGLVLTVSISMNFILIPAINVVGASITVLLTSFLNFILLFYFVSRAINIRYKKLTIGFIKALSSCLVMSSFLWYFREPMPLILIIPLAGIVYFFTLFYAGGIKKEDIVSIANSFSKKSL